jgi:hypothetical protein
MIAPRCGSCGGLLEAVPARAPGQPDDAALPWRLPELSPAFGRVLRLALFSLMLFAAARFGWSAGGGALALASIGFVGLFTVPLIVGE